MMGAGQSVLVMEKSVMGQFGPRIVVLPDGHAGRTARRVDTRRHRAFVPADE
jgi:hypothetical protein